MAPVDICGNCNEDRPCHKSCVVEAMRHVRDAQRRANSAKQIELSERLDDLLWDWQTAPE